MCYIYIHTYKYLLRKCQGCFTIPPAAWKKMAPVSDRVLEKFSKGTIKLLERFWDIGVLLVQV